MLFSAVLGLAALVLARLVLKIFIHPSLSVIRGPKSPSYIYGNLLELLQRPVGEADFAWQSRYGNVVRFKSIFGEDRLLIADPGALYKILNTSADNYARLPNLRAVSRLLTGKGLLWAECEGHRRQRSLVHSVFGLKECKEFFPIFMDCADAISTRWAETIGNPNEREAVINVAEWLSRGALDALGQAAFDIQFDTILDKSHPLAQEYKSYFNVVFGLPSAGQIFVRVGSKYIPTIAYQWLLNNMPAPILARARHTNGMTISIAKELAREKTEALLQGRAKTDIFTTLIKANMDANVKMKLSSEEMISQMQTLLVAGHDTTATTMAWILLELARHPEFQSRLRDEIRLAKALARARGDSRLEAQDLETMPYLNAVIKEGLRLHPPLPQATRIALQDDILSLSKPILTRSGEKISQVHVPKGTEIVVSIAAYHRDKDIWGEDAHEFKPERWLRTGISPKKLPGIGIYSHLLTFLSGSRSCIGWRFAIMEIQAFLSTLVGMFEFGMTDKAERILRSPALVMVPVVEGELSKGVQLPLSISLASEA